MTTVPLSNEELAALPSHEKHRVIHAVLGECCGVLYNRFDVETSVLERPLTDEEWERLIRTSDWRSGIGVYLADELCGCLSCTLEDLGISSDEDTTSEVDL